MVTKRNITCLHKTDIMSSLERSEIKTATKIFLKIHFEFAYYTVFPPGGALGYFLGGHVPPGTPKWHPVLEKISPKIDTPF